MGQPSPQSILEHFYHLKETLYYPLILPNPTIPSNPRQPLIFYLMPIIYSR